MIPDIPGLKESRWFTNENIFTLTELPKRLLVIGGGPIGCELGQAFARLGSKVTLAARNGLLRKDDPDAMRIVEAALRRDGIDIVPETPDPRGFDAVLVATGRLPNVEGLNLDAAGVKFDPKDGIAVDDHLRTFNRRIFAAGDVCSHRLQVHPRGRRHGAACRSQRALPDPGSNSDIQDPLVYVHRPGTRPGRLDQSPGDSNDTSPSMSSSTTSRNSTAARPTAPRASSKCSWRRARTASSARRSSARTRANSSARFRSR